MSNVWIAEKRQQDESHRAYFGDEIRRLQNRLAQSMEEASLGDQATYDAKKGGKARIEVRKRPGRSRLFQNGRPVPGALGDEAAPGASRRAAS